MYNLNRLRAARKLLPLPQPYNNIWLKINKVINELHIILINFICKTKYSSDLLKEKIPGLNTPVAEQTFVWAAKVNYYVRYAKVRTLKHDDKENISTLSKKRESYMTPDEIKAKKRRRIVNRTQCQCEKLLSGMKTMDKKDCDDVQEIFDGINVEELDEDMVKFWEALMANDSRGNRWHPKYVLHKNACIKCPLLVSGPSFQL
ncbi:Hypothetical predicted protein [Paramuricea clavata]|uniref:Uncharacterized protein n=1 Tax=Paramuricea clavata TaxID=317549 RepID=A0A7D9ISE2_PARCT|nr:Hypothetical predicted protein [Paramuricea clavata]